MCGGGQCQTNEVAEGGDGVNDQKSRQGMPSTGGQVEVAITSGTEKTIWREVLMKRRRRKKGMIIPVV